MKHSYLQPRITVIAVSDEDVIRTSGFELGEDLTPDSNQ